MPQQIAANDPRLSWSGHISLESNGSSVKPWRIHHDDLPLYDSELSIRAAMPAGVRLSFNTDSSFVELQCDPANERSNVDLVIDDSLVDSQPSDGATSVRFENLDQGTNTLEFWLPQFEQFNLRGISISDGAVISTPIATDSKKWITYGSSITQARLADSPTKTWPAIVARTRGYDLTCLGFGGQCHLDPMIARIIRDREADLISMCLGINIYGAASLNQRTFYPGILGFVQIVREKHPTTPIVLISPIYSPGRETTPNEVGFTLEQMRNEVERAVDTLRSHGDANVSYINGLDVFNSDSAHLLPDDLHPNNEGYSLMANNLLGLLPRI